MNTMVFSKPVMAWPPRLMGWALLLALAVGCASAPPQVPTQMVGPTPPEAAPSSRLDQKQTTAGRPIEALLRSEVRTWRGTLHKMGGHSRSGVDCSGFVQQIYRDILNHSIPRTTALQVKSGQVIQRARLRAGDLVFFKPPDKIRHVGIYLSRGEFAHASSSNGVMISNLSEDYWNQSYWTARRYLEP